MNEPGSSHQCLVCTVNINSTRFGLDACRACASFFKRSKVNGQKFTCRQGDKKCSTSIDAQFTCRGCRFEKCIAIGLVWDGPMRIRKTKVIPILKRIKLEWKALLDRRREQELKMIKQHGGHTKLSHPTEEIFYVHPETYSEIYRIFIEESYEFFKRVYPSFSEQSDKEQELIFKDYIVKMGFVEGQKRSMQYGVEDLNTKCTQYQHASISIDYIFWRVKLRRI
ncbi:hypothetical protein PRIPAC_79987 [Pristionchus pacificus]|nr:hypothetical protein PRIPAC_79987 [Pristionchus pacificus]